MLDEIRPTGLMDLTAREILRPRGNVEANPGYGKPGAVREKHDSSRSREAMRDREAGVAARGVIRGGVGENGRKYPSAWDGRCTGLRNRSVQSRAALLKPVPERCER